jgi:hypothetical protein
MFFINNWIVILTKAHESSEKVVIGRVFSPFYHQTDQ